ALISESLRQLSINRCAWTAWPPRMRMEAATIATRIGRRAGPRIPSSFMPPRGWGANTRPGAFGRVAIRISSPIRELVLVESGQYGPAVHAVHVRPLE